MIYYESQAEIRFVTNVSSLSINIENFFTECNLIMDSGTQDIIGNCIVDDSARMGIELATSDILQGIQFPIASICLSITQFFYMEAQSRQQQEELLDSARLIWIGKGQICLTSQNRMAIHRTVVTVPSHCPFSRHMERLGISFKDYCRSYGSG